MTGTIAHNSSLEPPLGARLQFASTTAANSTLAPRARPSEEIRAIRRRRCPAIRAFPRHRPPISRGPPPAGWVAPGGVATAAGAGGPRCAGRERRRPSRSRLAQPPPAPPSRGCDGPLTGRGGRCGAWLGCPEAGRAGAGARVGGAVARWVLRTCSRWAPTCGRSAPACSRGPLSSARGPRPCARGPLSVPHACRCGVAGAGGAVRPARPRAVGRSPSHIMAHGAAVRGRTLMPAWR